MDEPPQRYVIKLPVLINSEDILEHVSQRATQDPLIIIYYLHKVH